MVSSWRREDTMLGTFQSSAEAVRRVRTFQARSPASDGVEMVPVLNGANLRVVWDDFCCGFLVAGAMADFDHLMPRNIQ
jgi:hypothetical protein